MDVEDCIQQIDEAFNGQPWYGPSLFKTLEEIPVIFWNQTPEGASHSITELVYHIIDWKVFVLEKLKDNDTYSIEMNSEKDWRPNILKVDQGQKDKILKELKSTHESLCELLEAKPDSWVNEFTMGKDYSNAYMIRGAVQHDIYHLGQVNMLYSQIKTKLKKH
ncbi:DinB family protein [Aquimarina sp. D1M17]|uniref:DinB family protein n=1 Tax=Aquimarina acroporae TaxID=2937283 RepID=UPI0020BFB031|nr:DinB family protein [Aquimarina acroporae]MCK8522279.1 DinB family protein [Aquimarina acroporae]